MKKYCTYLIGFTLCWLLLAGILLQQQTLSSKLIRIHVLANSDSTEDQATKLQVRDAVLGEIAELTKTCGTRKEAEVLLMAHAEQLARRAAQTAGKPVTVSLSPEWYETRHYEEFSLPAGRYQSLQIGIGESAGKNWWCVAFPMVCTAAGAEDWEETAIFAGFEESEIRLMTEDAPDIEVRFAVLEWLQRIRSRWFSA